MASFKPDEEKLLDKISTSFAKTAIARNLPLPWELVVLDDDGHVFCAGSVRDQGYQISIPDATRDSVPMFHEPYRAELTAASPDNHKLHRVSISGDGSGLEAEALEGPLP